MFGSLQVFNRFILKSPNRTSNLPCLLTLSKRGPKNKLLKSDIYRQRMVFYRLNQPGFHHG